MNNKSFYILVALAAVVDLIFVIKPVAYGLMTTRAILCGSALYYIVQTLKSRERIGIYFPFMILFAVLYNPIVPFVLPEWSWLLSDMVALVVFYLLSRSISLPGGVTHKELLPTDENGADDEK